MRTATPYLSLGLLVLAACSSPAQPRGDDLSLPPGPDLSPVPGMDLSAGYPPGPYGNEVGQTLAPLSWEGYVNPTAEGLANTKPYGPYSTDDLRRSGARYALLYAADFF